MRLLTTQEKFERFGAPNQSGTYLVTAKLPYVMRPSWDLGVQLRTIRCHRAIVTKLEKALSEVLAHYGLKAIVALGLDLFGGCFNYRAMRGGSQWSSHAWGIAIDLDPQRNGLRTPWAKSQFAKPEYAKFVEIMERNGFISYGKAKGFDAMHFEVAA